MTERVAELAEVSYKNKYLGLFILSQGEDEDGDNTTDLKIALDRHSIIFGDQLGAKGKIVIGQSQEATKTMFGEISDKPWKPEISYLFEENEAPFLLIIQTGFKDFEPLKYDWRIIWLNSLKSPRKNIQNLFNALINSVERDGGDVFNFLDRVSEPLGQSIYGAISSPNRLVVDVKSRRPGAPSILDADYGIDIWIEEKIENNGFPKIKHGWKSEIIKMLFKDKKELKKDFNHQKSALDAFTRAGKFEYIKSRLNK